MYEDKELLDALEHMGRKLMCPCCKRIVSPPFYNLGAAFNWAEGCEDCYEQEDYQ